MGQCMFGPVFVCTTNNTDIKHRDRSRRDSSFNGKLPVIDLFDSLDVQGDHNNSHTQQHNVRFRLIYLSPNLCVCSHLGYKEGVAFYANKHPRKRTTLSYVQ